MSKINVWIEKAVLEKPQLENLIIPLEKIFTNNGFNSGLLDLNVEKKLDSIEQQIKNNLKSNVES